MPKRGRKVPITPHWSPELMTRRLMDLGYDVRISCKGDIYRFEATRPKVNYRSSCHVVFVRNGEIILPKHEEV